MDNVGKPHIFLTLLNTNGAKPLERFLIKTVLEKLTVSLEGIGMTLQVEVPESTSTGVETVQHPTDVTRLKSEVATIGIGKFDQVLVEAFKELSPKVTFDLMVYCTSNDGQDVRLGVTIQNASFGEHWFSSTDGHYVTLHGIQQFGPEVDRLAIETNLRRLNG